MHTRGSLLSTSHSVILEVECRPLLSVMTGPCWWQTQLHS